MRTSHTQMVPKLDLSRGYFALDGFSEVEFFLYLGILYYQVIEKKITHF